MIDEEEKKKRKIFLQNLRIHQELKNRDRSHKREKNLEDIMAAKKLRKFEVRDDRGFSRLYRLPQKLERQ